MPTKGRIEWPYVALVVRFVAQDNKLFFRLTERGEELVNLHLLKSPDLDTFITEFPDKGTDEITRVSYFEKDNKVWINPIQFFAGVPRCVWDFVIGDYRVCEKWLTDRKGRKLTYDDLQHWQRVVVAIKETIRVVKAIDDLTPSWPLP